MALYTIENDLSPNHAILRLLPLPKSSSIFPAWIWQTYASITSWRRAFQSFRVLVERCSNKSELLSHLRGNWICRKAPWMDLLTWAGWYKWKPSFKDSGAKSSKAFKFNKSALNFDPRNVTKAAGTALIECIHLAPVSFGHYSYCCILYHLKVPNGLWGQPYVEHIVII